jgi:hypothetical protein
MCPLRIKWQNDRETDVESSAIIRSAIVRPRLPVDRIEPNIGDNPWREVPMEKTG